jgi:hypothetical protein
MTDPDFAQRVLLDLLLRAHPSLLEIGHVREQLPETPQLDEAIELLRQDGLATQLGGMIGATRAAVRATQLTA